MYLFGVECHVRTLSAGVKYLLHPQITDVEVFVTENYVLYPWH